MKTKTLLLSVLFLFMSVTNTFATVQICEKIEYAGKIYSIPIIQPLQPYLAAHKDCLKVMAQFRGMIQTNCWRGYVGEWKIEENKLFLVRLTSYNDIPLNMIFKNQSGPIFASWFSGIIYITPGCFLLSHGEVVGKIANDNKGYLIAAVKNYIAVYSGDRLVYSANDNKGYLAAAVKKYKTAIAGDQVLNMELSRLLQYDGAGGQDIYQRRLDIYLKQYWNPPEISVSGNKLSAVTVKIIVSTTGCITSHQIIKSSGNRLVDDSVEEIFLKVKEVPKFRGGDSAEVILNFAIDDDEM